MSFQVCRQMICLRGCVVTLVAFGCLFTTVCFDEIPSWWDWFPILFFVSSCLGCLFTTVHFDEIGSQFFIRVILVPSVCQLCISGNLESGNLTFAFPHRQPRALPQPIIHRFITKLGHSHKKWSEIGKPPKIQSNLVFCPNQLEHIPPAIKKFSPILPWL